MKTLKQFFCLLASCMLAFGFTACEKDGPAEGAVWDFYPINFYFTLTGENGEDLLNPATPGSYAGLNIKATYEDKTYEKDVFEGTRIPYSRAYMAHLFGIYTTQLQDGRYALCFGELNGDDTYKDATLTLQWGDGTTDVITFSSKLKWKGHDPVIKRSFKLNGKEVAKDTNRPIIDVEKTALDYIFHFTLLWESLIQGNLDRRLCITKIAAYNLGSNICFGYLGDFGIIVISVAVAYYDTVTRRHTKNL